MHADTEAPYVEIISPFDWIERPLGVPGRMPLRKQRSHSLFEPLTLRHYHSPDPCGDAHVDFACEPDARSVPVKQLPKEENTYQMEPGAVFKPHLLRPVMQLILRNYLQDKVYDPVEAAQQCKYLADAIKDHAMKLRLVRYKFISDVMIGQKHSQGLVVASRCLWDESRDNFASVSFENKSLFAVATFFALNYE